MQLVLVVDSQYLYLLSHIYKMLSHNHHQSCWQNTCVSQYTTYQKHDIFFTLPISLNSVARKCVCSAIASSLQMCHATLGPNRTGCTYQAVIVMHDIVTLAAACYIPNIIRHTATTMPCFPCKKNKAESSVWRKQHASISKDASAVTRAWVPMLMLMQGM